MESLNMVDGIVIVVVLISAILAYARGLTREIMAIMGWVFSSIISFVFAPLTTPLIKEIPLLGPILADSCELAIIAAFASVFALSLLIFSFFTPLLKLLGLLWSKGLLLIILMFIRQQINYPLI